MDGLWETFSFSHFSSRWRLHTEGIKYDPPIPDRVLNRVLLREAGEHLGTLAEQAKERFDLMWAGVHQHARQKAYNEYARLARLSKDVLEVANG